MSVLIHGGLIWGVLYYGQWSDPPVQTSRLVPFNIHMLKANEPSISMSETSQEVEATKETLPEVAEKSIKAEPLSVKPITRVVKTPNKKKTISKTVVNKSVASLQQIVKKSVQISQPSFSENDTSVINKAQYAAQQLEELRSSYRQKVVEVLQRNKFYPKRARRRHHEGIVELQFTIHADGSIEDVNLIRRSGYQSLDQAATELLLKVGRFDPIPVELGLQKWQLKVPLQYKLSSG